MRLPLFFPNYTAAISSDFNRCTPRMHACMSVPARPNCAGLLGVSESNNILLISQVSLAIKCTKLTLHGIPLGTLFPPHKCFSYCPFVPLQNGVDACETERDTRGPRVHYSPLFSRGEWKITPLCLRRKSLPLTSWLRSVMSKGPEVCAV